MYGLGAGLLHAPVVPSWAVPLPHPQPSRGGHHLRAVALVQSFGSPEKGSCEPLAANLPSNWRTDTPACEGA